MTITRHALCGALFGSFMFFGAAPVFAEDMTKEEMIQSLQSGGMGKTRGIQVGTPDDAAAPSSVPLKPVRDISKELSKLKTTRQITVEERQKIADTVKESGLPAIDVEVYFDYDSDAIAQQALPDLIKLGQALSDERLKGLTFLIAGHTDAAGSDGYNLDLSGRRAESVKGFLVRTFQLDPERLITVGFGEEQLKDPVDPLSGVNRRVQIVNVEAANIAGH